MLKNAEETKTQVVQWIRDYFKQNMPKASAVIGISGGKDSSIAAALCVEALGKERVIGVTMPNGMQPDIEDSHLLIKHLGIAHMGINIKKAAQSFEELFSGNESFCSITGEKTLQGEALINYPPRLRMTTLYAVAQSLKNGGLVVNTCNASEDYVGYSTKFGDAAGDFSPLGSFNVEEVLQLGGVLGLPKELIYKTPSDGLSGMSDEEKLGFSYAQLDQYISSGVCEDSNAKEKIDRLHKRNLHKLQPMPRYQVGKGSKIYAD